MDFSRTPAILKSMKNLVRENYTWLSLTIASSFLVLCIFWEINLSIDRLECASKKELDVISNRITLNVFFVVEKKVLIWKE